jgi:hypothetical protein
VIELGADWQPQGGDTIPKEKQPFALEACPGQPTFNVPGKMRWATTAIARWDPDDDWPTDLCFILKLSSTLKTFDNMNLPSGMPSTKFRTTSLSWYLSYVRSDLAHNYTGGTWTSKRFDKSNVHECPHDAIVYLSFSSKIDHKMAYEALLSSAKNTDILKSSCASPSDCYENCGAKCLALKPKTLLDNKEYALTFPKDKLYSAKAGKSGTELTLKLSGLVPFTFPFRWQTLQSYSQIKYRRLNLYLRHGLSADTANDMNAAMQSLKDATSLEETDEKGVVKAAVAKLDYSYKYISKSKVQLQCSRLEPEKIYKISISGSTQVKDGFKQNLEASSMVFKTRGLNPVFLAAHTSPAVVFTSFTDQKSGGFKLLERGRKEIQNNVRASIAAWPVRKTDIKKAIVQHYGKDQLTVGEVKLESGLPRERTSLTELHLSSSSLLKGSGNQGLFVVKNQQSYSARKMSVSAANFAATVITTPCNEILVWATFFAEDAASGVSPVTQAEVEIYRVSCSPQDESSMTLVAQGTTGTDGTATLTPFGGAWTPSTTAGGSFYCGRLVAVVVQKDDPDQIAIVYDVQPPSAHAASLRAELITDRRIVRPGEKVYMKGYIRQVNPESTALLPPTGQYFVRYQWKTPNGPFLEKDVSVDSDYGTFDLTLNVPHEGHVTYGDIAFSLQQKGTKSSRHVKTTRITVADPRPPTVTMKLTTDAKVVLPGSKAELKLTAKTETYTGVPVGSASIELTWKVTRYQSAQQGFVGEVYGCMALPLTRTAAVSSSVGLWRPPSSQGSADVSGQETVVTLANGEVAATLNFPSLLSTAAADGGAAPALQEGDKVEVSAKWVGPTREVVLAELEHSVKVARSEETLKVTPAQAVNTDLPLPGSPLSVFVSLVDGANVPVNPPRPVKISLYSWDGQKPIREEGDGLQSGLKPPSSWSSSRTPAKVCDVNSDGGASPQCDLALPAVGKYVVVAESTDANGVLLTTAFVVGKTTAEWKKDPLKSLDGPFEVKPDKGEYVVGDTAKLKVFSPFKTKAMALVVWGNAEQKKSTRIVLDPATAGQVQAPTEVSLVLGDECKFGCNGEVALVSPTQPPVPPNSGVELSPMLDATLPRSLTAKFRLEVHDATTTFGQSTALKVSVTDQNGAVVVGNVEPGSKGKVKVEAPADTQVSIFVVDKAMLDVGEPANPHPATMLNKGFSLSGKQFYFLDKDTRKYLVSEDGYKKQAAKMMERANLDPWVVESSWEFVNQANLNSWSSRHFHQSNEDYLASKTNDLTDFSYGGSWTSPIAYDSYYTTRGGFGGGTGGVPVATAKEGVPVVESVETAPTGKSGNGISPAAGSGGAGKVIFPRSSFITTPLFAGAVVVGQSGQAEVEIAFPDNIATFQVRAYFVSKTNKFGKAETSVISRRQVSAVPSIPRVVRPGDKFKCGVSITGHYLNSNGRLGLPSAGVEVTAGTSSLDGSAIELTGAVGGTLSTNLNEASAGPHEVIFPMSVPSQGGLGSPSLMFQVKVQGTSNVVDALQVPLPVKAAQSQVTIATSAAINAQQTGSAWAEGIQLPLARPNSGELQLTAGVGYKPVVWQESNVILAKQKDNGEILVASMIPAAVLSMYWVSGVNPHEDANAEAMKQLATYTHTTMGLMWKPEDATNYRSRASVSLNAFGLLTNRLLKVFASKSPCKTSTTMKCFDSVPDTLKVKWESALETEIKSLMQKLYTAGGVCTKAGECYTHMAELAMIRASMGAGWNPTQYGMELSMNRLFKDATFKSLSPRGLAYAALAYMLKNLEATETKHLDDICSKLVNFVRVQGATAYITESSGSSHSAGMTTNALVLLALAWTKLTHPQTKSLTDSWGTSAGTSLLAKLAAYVAGPKEQSLPWMVGRWRSTPEAAFVSMAIAMYDYSVGSATPDLTLTVKTGPKDETPTKELLTYTASGPTDTKSVSTNWKDLQFGTAEAPKPPGKLHFRAVGTGQVSVYAAMNFVPASIPLKGAIYRGIYVEKSVKLMDSATGKPYGDKRQVVPLGTSVVVTIQITTPDDLTRVTLEDLSAGGLEPVDPNVAGDQSGSSATDSCPRNYGFGAWWWCFPSFPYRQTYADRVVWTTFDRLRAGTHTVSYQAIAATRGDFTLPAAYAVVDDQPELMGMSQGGMISIEAPTPKLVTFSDIPFGSAAQVEYTQEVVVFEASYLEKNSVARNLVVVPKACPACPSAGVCDVSVGKCMCQALGSSVPVDCDTQMPLSTSPAGTTTQQLGTTTTKAAQQEVIVKMTVKNVKYDSLQANSSLLENFKTAVKKGIISASTSGILEEHITLKLAPGSVIVSAAIQPPSSISPTIVKDSIQMQQVKSSVTSEVSKVPDIGTVTTGAAVSVEVTQVVLQAQSTTTVTGSTSTQSTTAALGGTSSQSTGASTAVASQSSNIQSGTTTATQSSLTQSSSAGTVTLTQSSSLGMSGNGSTTKKTIVHSASRATNMAVHLRLLAAVIAFVGASLEMNFMQ